MLIQSIKARGIKITLPFKFSSPLVFVGNNNKLLLSVEKVKKETCKQGAWSYLSKQLKVESMLEIDWTLRDKIVESAPGKLKIWLSKSFIFFLDPVIKC